MLNAADVLIHWHPVVHSVCVKHVRSAILIGSAKEKMRAAWQELIPVHFSDDLKSAVETAFSMAEPGENILLSPACSSFDMFKDFEDRGRQFKEIVHNLQDKFLK